MKFCIFLLLSILLYYVYYYTLYENNTLYYFFSVAVVLYQSVEQINNGVRNYKNCFFTQEKLKQKVF